MSQPYSQSNEEWMVYQHRVGEQVTGRPYAQPARPQVAHRPDAIHYQGTYYYSSVASGHSTHHNGSESFTSSASSQLGNSNAQSIQYPMDANSVPSTQMYPTSAAANGMTEYGVLYMNNPATFYADSGALGQGDNGSGHGYSHGHSHPEEPSNPSNPSNPGTNVEILYSDAVDPTTSGDFRAVSKPSRKRGACLGSIGRWTDIEHQTFLQGLNIYGRKWYVLCCTL